MSFTTSPRGAPGRQYPPIVGTNSPRRADYPCRPRRSSGSRGPVPIGGRRGPSGYPVPPRDAAIRRRPSHPDPRRRSSRVAWSPRLDDLLHIRPLLVEHLGAAFLALDADRVDVRPDRLEAFRALVHLRPPPPSPPACPRSPGPLV